MQDKPLRFVCNNCAATKAGEKCTDCVGKGCNCPCQGEGKPDSEPKPDWDDDSELVQEPHPHWHYEGMNECRHCDGECDCDNKAVERVQPEPVPSTSVEPTRLHEFWNAQSEWSQATFGTDAERGPIGPLKHLQKEAAEAQEKPTDIMEFVDCLFLTFDASRRAGFTLDQLTEAAFKKLEINKKRHYPKTTDMNAAVEHER